MVHLIGVEHKVQYKKPTWPASQARKDTWDRYSSIIERSIHDLQPSVVAEELNQEILDQHNKAESILKSVKEEYEARTGTKIQHIFAEPDASLKEAKGYKEREAIKAILTARMRVEPVPALVMAHVIAHQHPIREDLWLDAIKQHKDSEIIFVCGDIHLCTFRRLLKKRGINSRIVERGIGVDSSCLAEYEGLKFAQDNGMFSDAYCFCLDPILVSEA